MTQVIAIMSDKDRVSFDDGKCLMSKAFIFSAGMNEREDGKFSFKLYNEDSIIAMYDHEEEEEGTLLNILAQSIYLARHNIDEGIHYDMQNSSAEKPSLVIMANNKKMVNALRKIGENYAGNSALTPLEFAERVERLEGSSEDFNFNHEQAFCVLSRKLIISHYFYFDVKVIDLSTKNNVETNTALSRVLDEIYTYSGISDYKYECDSMEEFKERLKRTMHCLQEAKEKAESDLEPAACIIARNSELIDAVRSEKNSDYDVDVYTAANIH